VTISIVGGDSLLGRELQERLTESGFRRDFQLIGAEDEIKGFLTDDEDTVVVTPLDANRLMASDIVFCTGTRELSQKAAALIGDNTGPVVIDLTHGLEDLPNARLRAPLLVGDPSEFPKGTIHIVAHPAATALALVLTELQEFTRAVVQIFEPASERGQAGITELQKQTTALLAFQTLPKTIYDAQVGFNLLPSFGEDAPEPLADIEQRIDRHLASLLGRVQGTLPSLRLAQAPVFHGYSFSLWVEFESSFEAADLERDLATAHIDVRGADVEAPSNVGVAGLSGVTIGSIERDRNSSKAFWLWAVADNFRLSVDSAVAIAKGIRV
jgi:aspartate-semialdehyde dehydrogenase